MGLDGKGSHQVCFLSREWSRQAELSVTASDASWEVGRRRPVSLFSHPTWASLPGECIDRGRTYVTGPISRPSLMKRAIVGQRPVYSSHVDVVLLFSLPCPLSPSPRRPQPQRALTGEPPQTLIPQAPLDAKKRVRMQSGPSSSTSQQQQPQPGQQQPSQSQSSLPPPPQSVSLSPLLQYQQQGGNGFVGAVAGFPDASTNNSGGPANSGASNPASPFLQNSKLVNGGFGFNGLPPPPSVVVGGAGAGVAGAGAGGQQQPNGSIPTAAAEAASGAAGGQQVQLQAMQLQQQIQAMQQQQIMAGMSGMMPGVPSIGVAGMVRLLWLACMPVVGRRREARVPVAPHPPRIHSFSFCDDTGANSPSLMRSILAGWLWRTAADGTDEPSSNDGQLRCVVNPRLIAPLHTTGELTMLFSPSPQAQPLPLPLLLVSRSVDLAYRLGPRGPRPLTLQARLLSPPAAAANNQTGRTVYVGNLPADASVDELLNLVRFGPIESVRLLPEKSCVFISFLDGSTAAAFHADASVKKLALHGQELKIGWGKPSNVPAQVAQAITQHQATRNVYLGGLDDETTEQTLRDDLSRFGPIDQVKIVRDKNIGFVHFLTITTAAKVVNTLPTEPEWLGKRVNYGKDRCAYVCVVRCPTLPFPRCSLSDGCLCPSSRSPKAQQAAVQAAQAQAQAAVGVPIPNSPFMNYAAATGAAFPTQFGAFGGMMGMDMGGGIGLMQAQAGNRTVSRSSSLSSGGPIADGLTF